jgi:hypothetical protein
MQYTHTEVLWYICSFYFKIFNAVLRRYFEERTVVSLPTGYVRHYVILLILFPDN